MKVLFKKHVVHVGKEWEIKEVKSWYAQNFLFPNGLAVEFTNAEAKKQKSSKRKDEAHRRELLSNRYEIVESLNGKQLDFRLKSGQNNKVYWGIWEKDIIEAVKKQYKVDLNKKHIELMDGHLKSLWDHDIYIKLWKDAMAKMKANITAEKN
jgi:large subunit ribosomal protein L9